MGAEPVRLTRRKRLLFATVAIAGFLALAEAAARVAEIWRPPQVVDIGAGFIAGSRVFVPTAEDASVVETAETKRAAFMRQSFTAGKPPGTLRVVALGASSVQRADDEMAVLERRLWEALRPRYDRVEVINAGGLSYGSDRLVIVAAEILEYEPDVVMLYEAHNEFEEVEQHHLASIGTVGVQRALSHSAAVRLVRDLLVEREVRRLEEDRDRRDQQADGTPRHARAWRYEFTQADVARRMQAFRANYAAIIAACRRRNVPIVLGTVPSNLVRPALVPENVDAYKPVWALLDARRYAEAEALGRKVLAGFAGRHQSSDLENAILRDLATEFGVPLADVETAIRAAEPHHVPGETLFKDHCHLNDRGNAILRETFEEAVLRVLREAPTRGGR